MKLKVINISGKKVEDIDKLKEISERFSKIGSRMKLSRINFSNLLNEIVDYTNKRIPKTKEIAIKSTHDSNIEIEGDKILLNWAFENLIKNSIDAIDSNRGSIEINVNKKGLKTIIDLSDTGKGIQRIHWKKIFKPGYSTKSRGWGVGLSLTKRIIEQIHSGKISIDIVNSYCNNCDLYNLKSKCDTCNKPTEYRKKCPRCRKYREEWKCPKCKIPTQTHSIHQFDLQSELNKAIEQVKYKPSAPFKGTEKLGSKMKFPEPLAKGLLRNKYGLSTYRDATIRYDVTNMTLTHASSRMINTKIDKLIDLGYTHDIHGKPLENEDQIFELFIQDIVIPQEAGETLIRISKLWI